MTKVIHSADQFTIIGENIHATRAVLVKGRRVVHLDGGVEAVTYRDEQGQTRHLTVPEFFKEQQAYQQGQIKHFMVAFWKGVHGDADEAAEGAHYVTCEVHREIAAGAHFLDLNVDEVSPKLDEQVRTMKWLVGTAQQATTVPLSIDSSNTTIIAEGLGVYDGRAGRPLLNSVALERIDALDLVKEHSARVVVTAAGRSGMPSDAAERVANVSELVEAAFTKGIPASDIYIDGLVFPIAVSGEYGPHFLGAVSELRKQFGNEIHITGGVSNVSFGLPKRRLINETFLRLAIEHGLDSGIVDPVTTKVQRALDLDMDSEPVKLAMAALTGQDDFCMNYITAFREGQLG